MLQDLTSQFKKKTFITKAQSESKTESDNPPIRSINGFKSMDSTRLLHHEMAGFKNLPELVIRETEPGKIEAEEKRPNAKGKKIEWTKPGETLEGPETLEPTTSLVVRQARLDEGKEKSNVLEEIFAGKRSQPVQTHAPLPLLSLPTAPKAPIRKFKENVPVKHSDVKDIPKPASIQRLIAAKKSKKIVEMSPDLEDAVHPPLSQFPEAKTISLSESLEIQKKLKSDSDSRLINDAAERLVERLRGQALPQALKGNSTAAPQPWLPPTGPTDVAAMKALLEPRLRRDADKNNAQFVEGSFVQYREKHEDDEDLDDAIRETTVVDDGLEEAL